MPPVELPRSHPAGDRAVDADARDDEKAPHTPVGVAKNGPRPTPALGVVRAPSKRRARRQLKPMRKQHNKGGEPAQSIEQQFRVFVEALVHDGDQLPSRTLPERSKCFRSKA